jgi:hypothetical protein
MEKNIILKSVDNYEDIRLSDVKRLSNGTQFVSVGLLDEKISVSFKFSFQELYYKRLKELDFTEDIEIELINIIFKNNIEFNSKKLFKPSLLFQKCSFLHSFHFNDKIYENKTAVNTKDFMLEVNDLFPFDITHILTDNGLEFTNKLIRSKKGKLCDKPSATWRIRTTQ